MKKARRWIIGLTLATAGLVGVVAHATNYSLWVNGRGGGASGFGRVDCIPGHNAERAG
jgi:hypothetical protein